MLHQNSESALLAHKAKYKEILKSYLPEESIERIADWILHFNFNLKLTENRSSKLGDYRPAIKNSRPLITINHNLNKYSFLITLVHEIAHLTAFEKHKNGRHRILPHGQEWKEEYKFLMRSFMHEKVFPDDVMVALKKYMNNPAASSCADENLLRVLRNYDTKKSFMLHVEELAQGAHFLHGKRLFIKGEKIRKRFKCVEFATKREYLFSPLAEIMRIDPPDNMY
jgi:SprT protein